MTLLLSCCACGKNGDIDAKPLTGLPAESPAGFTAGILGASGSQVYTAESLKIKGGPAVTIAERLENDVYLFWLPPTASAACGCTLIWLISHSKSGSSTSNSSIRLYPASDRNGDAHSSNSHNQEANHAMVRL